MPTMNELKKKLKSKHKKTLQKIFDDPLRNDIRWDEVEKLLMSLGAEKREGKGSRMSFWIHEAVICLHKPHPRKEIKEYVVKTVRQYLLDLEIKP